MVYDLPRTDLLCFERGEVTGPYQILYWDEYHRNTRGRGRLEAYQARGKSLEWNKYVTPKGCFREIETGDGLVDFILRELRT